MNLAKTKKVVRDHIPHIVAAAAVATTIGVIAHYQGKMLFELPAAALEKMREDGGAYIYDYKGDSFMLSLLKK